MSKYRRHFPYIIMLVLIQFSLPQLWRLVYVAIRRPALVRAGARDCDSYVPQLKSEVPTDCDLVTVSRRGAEIEETFVAKRGNARKTVITNKGSFVQAETTYTLNRAFFVLPFLAVGVFLVATIHKMLRTQSFFTWQLSRFGRDQLETTLYAYAVPVFIAGFVGQFFLH